MTFFLSNKKISKFQILYQQYCCEICKFRNDERKAEMMCLKCGIENLSKVG